MIIVQNHKPVQSVNLISGSGQCPDSPILYDMQGQTCNKCTMHCNFVGPRDLWESF